MPGPALHHMIATRLRTRIAEGRGLGAALPPAAYAQIGALLDQPRNHPYFYLGCQGPDFLFFNTKDMNPALGTLVSAYHDVYDFIHGFRRAALSLVPQPVLDALAAAGAAADEVVSDSSTLSELRQLFGDVRRAADGLSAMVGEGVRRYVSDFDLFEIVGHPYRDGVPRGKRWWWFDAMHYRKTGKLAERLLRGAAPDSPLHLYAVGYLTHVTADTVGHPYVNAIAGGPYRSHAQRHKASENFQDVLNYRDVTGADWNTSAVHAAYNFNFDGTVDGARAIPDPDTHLPGPLAAFIAGALNGLYDEDGAEPRPDYGARLTPGDVDDAYRVWYRWLRSATDTGTLPPPAPYSLTAELREVWDKALENLGRTRDFIRTAADTAGDLGIWGVLYLLGALVLAAVAAVAAVADAVLGALTTLGAAAIRAAACLIYEQIYHAFETFRLAVAMNGLAFPMPQHLTDPRITHFGNPALTDVCGNSVASVLERLPTLRWRDGGPASIERHLVYPQSAAEGPGVFAVPPMYLDKPSTFYAWGDIPQKAGVVAELARLARNPATVDDAAEVRRVFADRQLLGNALTLTEAMYDAVVTGAPRPGTPEASLPDFNLDGDRGYGYLCWHQRGETAADFPAPLATEADPRATIAVDFLP